MEEPVSSYSQAAPSIPYRVSPVGSSKRKSKPVKRIVAEESSTQQQLPQMGTAGESTTTTAASTTTELKEEIREQDPKLEDPVKSMDQNDMLRKLTELLGSQFTMPSAVASVGCLFPTTGFPLFSNTGCSLDLSSPLTITNGDGNQTTNSTLANFLGSITFPTLAVNATPTTLSGGMPSICQTTDRLPLRTPILSSTSLANSKGPVKRKLFEHGNRDNSITREERIDLDDLENFAQMFKKQRIKFGFTQGDVGVALGRRYGTDFSQTTISRFEALNLSFKNMCKLRPLLKEWLADAESAIANGASLNDLLEKPNGEKIIKNDSPAPVDISTYGEPMVKRRRKRTNLDVAQRTTLDAYFSLNPRPDHERMTEIANLLDLDRDVVRVWFCNRRQKMRRSDEPDIVDETLLTSLRAITHPSSGEASISPSSSVLPQSQSPSSPP